STNSFSRSTSLPSTFHTLSLHDALPICTIYSMDTNKHTMVLEDGTRLWVTEGQEATVSPGNYVEAAYESKDGKKVVTDLQRRIGDRKSTRLNSSHQIISYAVFCLKKKKG